jgi:hypothetical protein
MTIGFQSFFPSFENFQKLCVCVENVFPIGQKRQKHFVTKTFIKKCFWRKKMSQIFFQILQYKNFLILKMNIFLDFSFSKKQ